MWRDGVGVEVVEEGADNRIGFRDMHALVMVFHHFGCIEAFEVRPTGLEDHFVDVNWWGSGGGV